jgi:hypothetical protein
MKALQATSEKLPHYPNLLTDYQLDRETRLLLLLRLQFVRIL